MKSSLLCATFVAAVMALLAASNLLPAQSKGAASNPGIALIDVKYVIKNLGRHKSEIDVFKQDVEQTQKQLKAEQTQIVEMQKSLQEYKAGSAAYKQKDEEITKRKANLAARVSTQEKEFSERNARLQWATYQEVAKEVERFARENGVSLVIQHYTDPVDPTNDRSVMAGIYRPVVYHAGLDISDIIKDSLNKRAAVGGAAGTGRPSGATATRPRSGATK